MIVIKYIVMVGNCINGGMMQSVQRVYPVYADAEKMKVIQ